MACGQGCGEKVEWRALDKHKAETCARRTVVCSLGCSKKLPEDEREKHEMWCVDRSGAAPRGCNGVR